MASVNDLLEEDADPGKFMTFYFGVLESAERRIRWVSAGHDPSLVYRRETDEFLEMPSTGLPLGVMPGSEFGVREMELRPGDTIVFGTDGIWEARDRDAVFYGKERLRDLVRHGRDEPLAALSDRLLADLDRFHDGAEPRDDITAVLMRVLDGDV